MMVGMLNGAATLENSSAVPQNVKHRDFSGGAVVKNPPANAGDMGLSPGPGRSHMVEHLSPCATTTEARPPGACAPQQEKPLQ